MSSYTVGEVLRAGQTVLNEIKLSLPSLSVNEGIARAAVAVFCSQADPSTTELADIKCAVSEAVTTQGSQRETGCDRSNDSAAFRR